MKFGSVDAVAICMCSLLLACTQTQEVVGADPGPSRVVQAVGESLASQSALESASWDSGGGIERMKDVSALAH
jgi:hypothetical protein